MQKGDPFPKLVAEGADIRTDVPRYRVYRGGGLESEVSDIAGLWRDDYVAFLLGCSFTFESRLLRAGIPVRHIECGCNVPMYITSIACRPFGIFDGPMVVSMRPVPARLIAKAVEITAAIPAVHGSPVHIGSPEDIGILDIGRPDYGDPVPIQRGEVPVFWACGVTPQAVGLRAKPEIMITHSPGHMFVCDVRDEDIQDLISGA